MDNNKVDKAVNDMERKGEFNSPALWRGIQKEVLILKQFTQICHYQSPTQYQGKRQGEKIDC